MIEIISDLPDHVLGVQTHGEVTAEDYKNVLVPAIDAVLTKHKRVRLLYVFGKDFDGFTGGAAWEDAKVGMKHLTAFQRVAVVSDTDSIRTMVKAFGFALPGEVRVYPADQLPAAREWIAQPPSQGHLAFQLDRAAKVLLLEPRGELEAADFERLSSEIDPYLEKEGTLNGVAVVAEHFPGWEDLFALGSHYRFIRDHHKKIRRIALVTDDRLASAVPPIAARFVRAKLKTFHMAERAEAMQWVGQS